MLNFLISVISDTYARVQERSKMHQYRYKNALNIEYLHIRDRFFDSKHITCVIIVTDQETYKTEPDAFGEFSE